jgi:hypothetical protein
MNVLQSAKIVIEIFGCKYKRKEFVSRYVANYLAYFVSNIKAFF